MREITSIVIHHADTPDGYAKYGVRNIDAWHAARGFQREETAIASYNPSYPYIGYHEVIDVYGKCWMGRGENEVGAHEPSQNANGLAVCLLGRNAYTTEQWEALKWVVEDWKKRYGEVRVIGHRDVNSHTECPGFAVQKWVAGGMEPLTDHLYKR